MLLESFPGGEKIFYPKICLKKLKSLLDQNTGFPGGSDGKEPAMWETWVWSLAWEDPQRRAWQPTPVFNLAWRLPWTEKPGGLQSTGLKRVRHDWVINTHTQTKTLKCWKNRPKHPFKVKLLLAA